MTGELKKIAEDALSARILSSRHVGGGCINESFHLSTDKGDFFLKWNDSRRYPGMFAAEAKGLKLLAEGYPHVPGVIVQQEVEDISILVLEWIESDKRSKDFWQDFGRGLAKMHRNTADTFGLDYDNYIGSLRQSNKKHASWVDFFVEERLRPQIHLANQSGRLNKGVQENFESLFNRMNSLIPDEKPSLLHGDLWSGNFLVNREGNATLIDPAVYYGHREADLAMTRLFGGFDQEFYKAYQDEYPLSPGFADRVDLFNLYPLLVHVNLFGGGYASQVQSILFNYR